MFPTSVGVSPLIECENPQRVHIPHTSGGASIKEFVKAVKIVYSSHKWG